MPLASHFKQEFFRFKGPGVIDDRLKNVGPLPRVFEIATPKKPAEDRTERHQDLGRGFRHPLSISGRSEDRTSVVRNHEFRPLEERRRLRGCPSAYFPSSLGMRARIDR